MNVVLEFPRPNIVEKKLREIDETLQLSEFKEILKKNLDNLIKGITVKFSDIVTGWSGLPQLIYESGGYCFGEDDGSITELNESQKIRLEYARKEILRIFQGYIDNPNDKIHLVSGTDCEALSISGETPSEKIAGILKK